MKKFSVILVIILLFVQILPLYSFATSQDKETAPYVPSIYDVYAGELSYEEYLKLDGEPVRLEAFPTGTYYLSSIKARLYSDIGLDLRNNESLYRSFMAEVELGSLGGFDRNTFRLSFDGLRCLLNFYLFQYAKYEIINLDTVNVYTPATAADITVENEYARNLCSDSFDTTQEIKSAMVHNPTSHTTVIGTSYNGVSWYNVGESFGSKYFYASDNLYNYYNVYFPFETYAANNNFLLDSLFSGDTIYCSHNPAETLLYYPNSIFAKEIMIIQDFYNTYGNGVSFVQRVINGYTVWVCIGQ